MKIGTSQFGKQLARHPGATLNFKRKKGQVIPKPPPSMEGARVVAFNKCRIRTFYFFGCYDLKFWNFIEILIV